MTMKFVKPIAATLAICLSAGAYAGVQDKKAKRASDEKATCRYHHRTACFHPPRDQSTLYEWTTC